MLGRRVFLEAAGGTALAAFAGVTSAGATGAAARLGPSAGAGLPAADASGGPRYCIFSKHLPDLGWTDLATATIDMGFDGIDLTVRSKGHVLPERVSEDLPRALDAIRAKGTTVAMITTEVTSARTSLSAYFQ